MPEFKLEGLSEEQNKDIQAEIDRRVSEAVRTTTRKVTNDVTKEVTDSLTKEYEEKIQAAILEAQNKASLTDQEKIAALERGEDIEKSSAKHNYWAAGPEDFDMEAWVSAANKMYGDTEFREKIKKQLVVDRVKLDWSYVALKFMDGFRENGYIKD